MDETNPHGGHRKRLKERFSKYPESLSDNELLELLLFYAIPRKDTNELAHRLLRLSGGSLKKLTETAESALRCVEGAGEESARLLRLTGAIAARCAAEKKKRVKFEYNTVKDSLVARFEEETKETMWLFLIDGKGYILAEIPYAGDGDRIDLPVGDIVEMIALYKPSGAALAHNHPSGMPDPSAADDETTAKILKMFALHGVRLYDHIIVAGRKTYSYHYAGRLAALNHD